VQPICATQGAAAQRIRFSHTHKPQVFRKNPVSSKSLNAQHPYKHRWSLPERVMGNDIRTHKLFVPEADLNKNRQSMAYQALNAVSDEFGKSNLLS